MMNNNSLPCQLSAVRFAMWDLHLYLDTHPNDCAMTDLWNEYANRANRLTREYERMYGPLTPESGIGMNWTKEPWPWQNCVGDR
ncbi:MAG: spore coat protein CotJB [Acutalibacteraceae bacterium]|nr:spore coat protein CotJB [Oscillospiraceae bacterium]